MSRAEKAKDWFKLLGNNYAKGASNLVKEEKEDAMQYGKDSLNTFTTPLTTEKQINAGVNVASAGIGGIASKAIKATANKIKSKGLSKIANTIGGLVYDGADNVGSSIVDSNDKNLSNELGNELDNVYKSAETIGKAINQTITPEQYLNAYNKANGTAYAPEQIDKDGNISYKERFLTNFFPGFANNKSYHENVKKDVKNGQENIINDLSKNFGKQINLNDLSNLSLGEKRELLSKLQDNAHPIYDELDADRKGIGNLIASSTNQAFDTLGQVLVQGIWDPAKAATLPLVYSVAGKEMPEHNKFIPYFMNDKEKEDFYNKRKISL